MIDSGRTVALVGPGRAGATLALALARRGARVVAVAGRAPDAASTRRVARLLDAPAVGVAEAGRDADLVLVATPDEAIGAAGAAAAPGLRPGALVVHLSGARGLDALAPLAAARPDVRIGALHPLQTFPEPETGAARLPGSWAAVAGPDDVVALARALDLVPVVVDDDDRARYHAAAAVASNHLVALLGQVERIGAGAGVPLAAYLPLVRAALEHAVALGPAAALTGPVARGDASTVAAHLAALPPDERHAYRALAAEALRLSGRDDVRLRALLDEVVA